jgi:hypothetical protein
MSVFRAVYSSRPFGFDAGTLSGILSDARRLNTRDGVTGALICRHDIFLQWLEGPEDVVRATLARIARDDRHVDVRVHVTETVPDRLFADWSMLHDPAATWIWTVEQVADDIRERASSRDVKAFFLRLYIRWAAAGPKKIEVLATVPASRSGKVSKV